MSLAPSASPTPTPVSSALALVGLVDTLAGASVSGQVNAVGTAARFFAPQGLAADGLGNVFVADSLNNIVRVIDLGSLSVSTLSGGGASGTLGGAADGVGSNALFLAPSYIATDSGQLYVSDVGNSCIRRITAATGLTTTFVGGGSSGFAAGFTDGVGSSGLFGGPMQLAVAFSTLFVADAYNHAVRAVDLATRAVSTLAGGGGAALGASGYLNGAGTAALFSMPQGLAVDPNSATLIVADVGNSVLRSVDVNSGLVAALPAGGFSFAAAGGGPLFAPCALAIDSHGVVYVADGGSSTVRTIASVSGGGVALLAGSASGVPGFVDGSGTNGALFRGPGGLALDPSTTELYVSDTLNNAIRRIGGARPTASASPSAAATLSPSSTGSGSRSAAPTATTVCCTPGTSGTTMLNSAAGANWRVTGGSGGYLLLQLAAASSSALSCCAGCGGCSGAIGCWGCAVAGGSSAQYRLQVPVREGDTVLAAPIGAQGVTLLGTCACGGVNAPSLLQATSVASATASASALRSASATVSSSITSSATGMPTRPAAPTLSPSAYASHSPAVSWSSSLSPAVSRSPSTTVSGSGTRSMSPSATQSSSSAASPSAGPSPSSYLTPTPTRRPYERPNVTTFIGSATSGSADGLGTSARLNKPYSVALSGSAGSAYLFVADTYNHKIRAVTRAGDVTTLVGGGAGGTSWGSTGGVGTASLFYFPYGVAVTSAGNVLVADTYNCRVRVVSPDGQSTTTLAGGGATGTLQGAADGQGTNALFNRPHQLAVGPTGVIYVSDSSNHRVCAIALDGTVSTLAGGGASKSQAGYAEGVGAGALFNFPYGLDVSETGSIVYVCDAYNSRVRAIATSDRSVTTFVGGGGVANAGAQYYAGHADGTGTAAMFDQPGGLVMGADGALIVGDSGSYAIRAVSPDAEVTLIAGGGTQMTSSGYVEGSGTSALFGLPFNLAYDATGILFVADAYNNAIRVLAPVAPTAPATPSARATSTATRAAQPSPSPSATASASAKPASTFSATMSQTMSAMSTASASCCVPLTNGTTSLNNVMGASWRVAGGHGYMLLQLASSSSGALSCCAGCGSCAGAASCWGCTVLGGASAAYRLLVTVSPGDAILAAPSGAQAVTLLGACGCGGDGAPSLAQATALATPSAAPSASTSMTPSASFSRSPTASPSASAAASVDATPSTLPSSTPSFTTTPTGTRSNTATPSGTRSSTLSALQSPSSTTSASGTLSATASAAPSPSAAPTSSFVPPSPGATWVQVPNSGPCDGGTYALSGMAVSADGAFMAVSTSRGNGGGAICTSADGGMAWTQQAGASSAAYSGLAMSADGARIVAITGTSCCTGYIYVSADFGLTWTRSLSVSKRWLTVACDATCTRIVAGAGGVWQSRDGGASWASIGPSGAVQPGLVASSADGFRLLAAASGSNVVFVSTNSGLRWSQASLGSGTATLSSVACAGDFSLLAASSNDNSGSVWVSSDGVSWATVGPAGQYNTVAMAGDGSALLAGAGTSASSSFLQWSAAASGFASVNLWSSNFQTSPFAASGLGFWTQAAVSASGNVFLASSALNGNSFYASYFGSVAPARAPRVTWTNTCTAANATCLGAAAAATGSQCLQCTPPAQQYSAATVFATGLPNGLGHGVVDGASHTLWLGSSSASTSNVFFWPSGAAGSGMTLTPTYPAYEPLGVALGPAVGAAGNVLYISRTQSGGVYKRWPNGTSIVMSSASAVSGPRGVAYHAPSGSLFVACRGTSSIVRLLFVDCATASNAAMVVVKSVMAAPATVPGFSPLGVAVTLGGTLFVAAEASLNTAAGDVWQVNNAASGSPSAPLKLAQPAGGWGGPDGVSLDAAGNLFVSSYASKAWLVPLSGTTSQSGAVSGLAPQYVFGSATLLASGYPYGEGIAVDPCSGSAYIGVVDAGTGTGEVLAVTHATSTPSPTPSTTPSLTPSPSPTPVCPGSSLITGCALIVGDVSANTVWAVTGSSATSAGTRTVVTSAVPSPSGIFVTAAGQLFISSQAGYVYSMAICSGQAVSPALIVSLPGALLTDVAIRGSDLYVVEDSAAGSVWRYPGGATACTAAAPCGVGSGRVAVGGAGAFRYPFGISVSPNGDVYVADSQATPGEVVKVPASGGANVVVVNSVGTPRGIGGTGGVFVTATGDIVASFIAAGAVAWVPAAALPCADMTPYSLGSQSGNGNSQAIYVTGSGVVYATFNGNAVVKRYDSAAGWTTVGYGMMSPQGVWSACNA